MATFLHQANCTPLPTIHVISDSIGSTARTVAEAAAAQFGVMETAQEILSYYQRMHP